MIKTLTLSLLAISAIFLSPAISNASTAQKIGADARTNELVQYAYDISGWNKRFIWTIDAENSKWTIDRRSNTGYWRNGKKYYDFWICQISEYYHKWIVNDIRFWTDEKWQLQQCWRLYKGWTKFYGSKNANRQLRNFQFK